MNHFIIGKKVSFLIEKETVNGVVVDYNDGTCIVQSGLGFNSMPICCCTLIKKKKEISVYDADNDPRFYFELLKLQKLTDYNKRTGTAIEKIVRDLKGNLEKVYNEKGPIILQIDYATMFDYTFKMVEYYEELLFAGQDNIIAEISSLDYHELTLCIQDRDIYCYMLAGYLQAHHKTILESVDSKESRQFKEYNKFLMEFLQYINTITPVFKDK